MQITSFSAAMTIIKSFIIVIPNFSLCFPLPSALGNVLGRTQAPSEAKVPSKAGAETQ